MLASGGDNLMRLAQQIAQHGQLIGIANKLLLAENDKNGQLNGLQVSRKNCMDSIPAEQLPRIRTSS